MKASHLATPLARLALVLVTTSVGSGLVIAQSPPPAGAGLNGYAPGAIQPPAYQMPVAPRMPTPPPGPPPPGFNAPAYRPPAIGSSTPNRAPVSTKKSTSKPSTPAKPTYRPPAGSSSTSKTKSAASPLETRVGKLESTVHRQDLRLGRIERDVGLLPDTIEGGGVADKVPAGKTHIVRPGDTLYNVASRYNTSVGELRSLNRLSGDTLDIGESLLIPDGQTWSSNKITSSTLVHVVAGGENFEDIARAYGVRGDAIARANPTVYATDLRAGERLIIPNPTRIPGTQRSSPQAGKTVTVTTGSTTHTVGKGDTLMKIASKYRTTVAKIVAANRLKNPNVIPLGKRLTIPGVTSTRTVPAEPAWQDQETQPLAHLRLADEPGKQESAIAPLKPAEPLAPIKPEVSSPTMPRGIVAYRMERGDTLDSVANMFSTTVANIRAMNQLQADKELKEGDEVYVPTVGAVSVN
jgi:LysM repeat protein